MQAQRQQQQQQLNADAYNEFLMDVNRIQDMNEGQALIQAYKQQGVSTEVITEMIQTLNDRFGY